MLKKMKITKTRQSKLTRIFQRLYMTEIKSTLDLVMEKTRHLSFSEQEKQEQHFHEFAKRIKGLIQQYQDQKLRVENLKIELSALQQTFGLKSEDIIKSEIVARLDLHQDNRPLLTLLPDLCRSDVTPLESITKEYKEAVYQITQARTAKVKQHLAEKYFIAGEAVVPNLENDEAGIKKIQQMRDKFDRLFTLEKSRLADSVET